MGEAVDLRVQFRIGDFVVLKRQGRTFRPAHRRLFEQAVQGLPGAEVGLGGVHARHEFRPLRVRERERAHRGSRIFKSTTQESFKCVRQPDGRGGVKGLRVPG